MQQTPETGGGFRLSDPRLLWLGLAIGAAGLIYVSSSTAMMLLVAILVATATQPLVELVGGITRLSYGKAALLTVFIFSVLLGIALWFLVPLLVSGVKELVALMPKNAGQFQELLEKIRHELETIIPAEALDELLRRMKEAGAGGHVVSISAQAGGKILTALAHFAFFFVFYLMLVLEWHHVTEWTSDRFRRAFPRQVVDASWLAVRFQEHLVSICRAVVRIMVVFAPIYGLMFYILGLFVGGISPGRAAVYGLVFGALGGIPTIGGFLMYPPMWVAGFLEFVWPKFQMKTEVLWMPGSICWYILIAASLVGHSLEAKLVTPLILGQHLKLAAIGILVPLVTCAMGFGLTKGIVLGFSIIALAKAWDDLVVERGEQAV